MGCGLMEVAIPLMLAGTASQMYASNAEGGAENRAVANEMRRQREYQQRATGLFNQSLGQSAPQAAQQQIQQGRQQALQAGQPAMQMPYAASTVPLPGGQDRLSQARLSSQLGLGQQANANLQGYGNYPLQQSLKDMDIGGQLGVVNREASQSAGVLPAELQQASQSQSGLTGIGQLLSAGGLLAGLGSLAAAPAAGAGSAAGASGVFDWSNPATWGAEYVQPMASGAYNILPSAAAAW